MTKHDRRIEWSEKTCGVLLLLYPAPFRERFGQEILSVFRECCEEQLYGRQRGSLFSVWLQTLKDLAFSILRERVDGLLGSRQNRELLFRASMDSIALFGICLYVALWGQAMALCAIGPPKKSAGDFVAAGVWFTLSLGGVCILRSLIVARVRPHSYLCLGLKGRDLGSMTAVVEMQNLKKHYRMGSTVVRALDGVSITIAEGEFVALLGRSGSGKSTLLNLIAGLDHVTSGTLRIDGNDLATMSAEELSRHRQQTVGIIFQSFNLVSTMSALENVTLSMIFAGVPKIERERRATLLLGSMGLAGRQSHTPKELSGGEQQRVAISRALANKPRVLLADEPTGNLDSRTSTEIMELLKDLNEREGKTVILVTHDANLAAQYAHRTITLMDGIVEASASS